jgi:hypothetical protein
MPVAGDHQSLLVSARCNVLEPHTIMSDHLRGRRSPLISGRSRSWNPTRRAGVVPEDQRPVETN